MSSHVTTYCDLVDQLFPVLKCFMFLKYKIIINMADFGHSTFIFIIGTGHHIHKKSRQPQLSRQHLPFIYVYASQFFVVIGQISSGQFVFTEMSFLVPCNFIIALPKGGPLVHHPTEAIHPAHHCMTSTPLVHQLAEAMQTARKKMRGHHVRIVRGSLKESYRKREGSMKSSRE